MTLATSDNSGATEKWALGGICSLKNSTPDKFRWIDWQKVVHRSMPTEASTASAHSFTHCTSMSQKPLASRSFLVQFCKDLGEGLGWINKILESLKWSCWRTNSGQFKIPKQKNKPIRAVLIRIPNRKQKQSSLSGMFCRTSFIPNQFRAVRIASYSYLVTISISFYCIGVSIRQQNEFFEENMVSSVTCHFRQVFILPRRCCNLERNIRIFGRARKISWKNHHFREILFRKGRRPGRGV